MKRLNCVWKKLVVLLSLIASMPTAYYGCSLKEDALSTVTEETGIDTEDSLELEGIGELLTGTIGGGLFGITDDVSEEDEIENLLEWGGTYDVGVGVLVSYQEAEKEFLKAAEQGNADAQFRLGLFYANNVENQNYPKAVKWYLKAAEQGHVEAQFNLGFLYANGLGGPANYEEAIRWYRKAAEQENYQAQFNLGLIYYMGDGHTVDYGEALKYFRKAAGQGYAKAQFNLGVMMQNGSGVPKNIATAAKWYQKAAIQGHALAQYNLGELYLDGKGIGRDYVRSYVWTSFAANQGIKAAEDNLALLEEEMAPEQIQEAKQKADMLRVRYRFLSS